MWSTYFLCLLVGFAAASDYAWKSDTEYHYNVRGRTLASLHQVDNQYTGIVIRAELTVRPKHDGLLQAKLQNTQYAQVHAKLPGGWKSEIPESQLSFRPMQLANKPFEIKLKNGTVQELIVDKSIPNWEANIIKSVISQIQVDVQGENMIKSRFNQPAEHQTSDISAEFKTMEDTVTGKCETLYDISELPEYLVQSQPELVPFPQFKADGDFIDVIKTRNYSNCDERIVYHYGLSELEGFEPAASNMGDFLTKSSVSRIILSGNLKRYTIQSSVTTNKIVMKPTPNAHQRGLVVSHMNITLAKINPVSGQSQEISERKVLGNLVYRYNSPYASHNEAREGNRNSEEHKYGSDSSSSSSSSSSSEEHNQEQSHRMRHPRSLDRFQDKQNRYDSSSSSSSSSSEESGEQWQQTKPSLASPPETPLLPYTIGYQGQSIKSAQNINIIQAVQKLAKQIGEDLQTPSDMPKEDTLAKFTILRNLIRTMNYQEMQEASRELYNLKNKQERKQTDSWRTFRDAVAQAGTGPALLIVKDWIQNMKIRGTQAASIIATVADNARTPTDEYMKTFYTLATDSKVLDEPYLNDTAILSFAELVHSVYVDKEESHNEYPVHAFGKFYKQNREALHKEYIPYCAKQMKQAIHEADSHKIHVYIRCLGNIGECHILEAFEPYLEGQKQVSQFQRLLMIVSMDKLAKTNPKCARSVLYKTYQNEGENPETRVAAVHHLMRTSPPSSMLQRMAEATHFDSSNYVSAAVKSVIQTAANLKHSAHAELARAAQAAVHLLNDKSYGIQYSKQYLSDYVVREMNLVYKQHVTYLQSDDSIIPQGFLYSLKSNMGGLTRQYMTLQAMLSSVNDLYKVWGTQTTKDEITKESLSKQQSQWASEQIARLLKINYEEREQLEGNVHFGFGGIRRFYTFDNQTIEQLPQYLKELSSTLKKGEEFNHTKFYNSYEMIISFPTEMGLPFVYTLDTPTLVSLHGEVKVITHPQIVSSNEEIQTPETVNVTADIRAVVYTKTQAKLGFVTPFEHQHYVAGYDKQVQLNLPLRVQVDIDVENQQVEIEMEPLDDQSEEVFHYSTRPYTAKHDILNLKPISRIATSNIVHVREPMIYEHTFGKKLGMAFHLKAKTEQKFADFKSLYESYQRHEGWSYLMAPLMEDSLVYTNFSLQYVDELSHADSVNFQMGWNQTHFAGQRDGSDPEFQELYKKASDLEETDERQEFFMKKAAVGINNADASVYDMSIQFRGKEQHQYNATFAVATSSVDKKSRVLFYYNKDASNEKDHELCFYAQNKIPNTNALDFVYALKFDPTSTSQMKFAYGENCQTGAKVDIKAKWEQSEERQRYLQSRPMAKLCFEQMKHGDKQLYACRNMTARANFLDQYSFDIKYENMSPEARNWTYKAYSVARHLGYPYMSENIFEGHGQRNQIKIEANFEPDFESMNVTLEAEKMQAEYNNIRFNNWAKAVVAVHPVFDVQGRLAGEAQNEVFNPTCVVDQNHVNTFDNRSYPIDLGKTWHVQMHYRVQRAGRQEEQGQDKNERFQSEDDYDYVVLVRDSENNKKEVKLTLNDEKNYYEIDMVPASGNAHSGSSPAAKVMVNQQQIKFDDQHSYDIEDDLLQIYALPNGDVKIEVNGDFYVIYDGERVKLTTTKSDQFRGEVRGLCGTFDGEQTTDFATPKNCILRDPLEFASTWAIIDGSSQGPAKERQARAHQSACIEVEQVYANVVSPRDYRHEQQKQHQQQHHESRQHSSGSCSKLQTQAIEEDNGNTICFTTRPLPVCRSGCKADKKVVKGVDVHCIQKSKVSDLWQSQIAKGANPDFAHKPVTKEIKIKVAQSCSA